MWGDGPYAQKKEGWTGRNHDGLDGTNGRSGLSFNNRVEYMVIQSIHLQEMVTRTGNAALCHHTKERFPHYFSGAVHEVTEAEYYRLLGYEPPYPNWDPDQDLGLNDTIAQAKYKNGLGKTLYAVVLFFNKFFHALHKPLLANNVYFVLNLPFRQIEN